MKVCEVHRGHRGHGGRGAREGHRGHVGVGDMKRAKDMGDVKGGPVHDVHVVEFNESRVWRVEHMYDTCKTYVRQVYDKSIMLSKCVAIMM